MAITLSRVLDRIASTPSFVRKLKGDGSLKIREAGETFVVGYKRFSNGTIEFDAPVSEATAVRPVMTGAAT